MAFRAVWYGFAVISLVIIIAFVFLLLLWLLRFVFSWFHTHFYIIVVGFLPPSLSLFPLSQIYITTCITIHQPWNDRQYRPDSLPVPSLASRGLL
ncbi:uncharacterized protein BDW47DRAFT_100714 [Aspergillus candidus]|uniref:Uncharacterized protein n=1 Tax=Aspergillus candidus TaxID=41067 RepID=A0A2I2FJC0_ASPCN|nr:hypothetical protein BDW47DRAFT_100714 [Aspergillus candidus]PLB40719.1 hypothetical protein BDW47DRAFT_100714 [Aspergillus candidus]